MNGSDSRSNVDGSKAALAAIVCGMPFSGTTLMARLLCCHPLIDAGFECGMLFGESPRAFLERAPKFYGWMMSDEPPHNWKLSERELESVCATSDFGEAYRRLVRDCHLFEGEAEMVLDKTPAYCYDLPTIMAKVPDTPVFVVRKDPVFQYYSYLKRGHSLEMYLRRLSDFNRSLAEVAATADLRSRLLVVDYEVLVGVKARCYKRMINFVNHYHSAVKFDVAHVDIINDRLVGEIRSRERKLRPGFKFEKEMAAAKSTIPEEDRRAIEALVEKARTDQVPVLRFSEPHSALVGGG